MATVTSQPRAIKPTVFELELTAIVQGILKNLPATVSLTLSGTSMKQPVIVSTLQDWLKQFQAVEDARQTLRDALNKRLGITVEARTFYKVLKAAIKAYFGPQSPLLASFGIAADKAHTRTAAQNLVAAGKRQQTRHVRGTKSRKQRLAVKVVGEPSVAITEGGVLEVSAPAINPAVAAATASTPPSSPAPAGADSGSAPDGSKPPAA